MKQVFFIFCCSIAIASCNQADTKAVANNTDSTTAATTSDTAFTTSIQWIDSTFQDIGKVKEGQTVEVTYRFKNVGDKPLVVSNVRAGCGCTVADKPEEPVAPGQQSQIKAVFNSKGQSVGEHRKDVYMASNVMPDNNQTLTFRVEVIK